MRKVITKTIMGICLCGIIIIAGCQSAPKPTAAEAKTPAAQTPAPAKGGILSAEKVTYDFGNVDPGARLEGGFVLKNTGTASLVIGDTKTSCGCTVAQLEKNQLEPGETTELKFVYHTSGVPGKSTKKITVKVQPPSTPEKLELNITAEIIKYIKVTPESMKFEVHPSSPSEFPLVLESVDKSPFKITKYSSTNAAVTLDYDKELSAAEHSLKVKLDRANLGSLSSGSLAIEIDHPKTKNVQVQYQIVQPYTATPRARYFRDLVPGKESTATIIISSNFKEPFELGEITSESGLVKVSKIEKTAEGYQLEVTVTLPQGGSELKDQLIIPIKDHPESTLTVLCYGRAAK